MHGFVGVHVGAGYHSKQKTDAYKQLCNEACNAATEMLNAGHSAAAAVVKAVKILENSPLTNAGYGSSLTEDGTVECDAGVMDGQCLQFGAVGAVPGVRNPIELAKRLLDEQCNGLRDLGRIPPSFLVGPAARQYALKMGVEICQPHEQISESARKTYDHYKKKLSDRKETTNKKMRLEDLCNIFQEDEMREEVSDTVGAVVLDRDGNVAAATSSGGLLLKNPGRVGQAAVFGCGCWAQNKTEDQLAAIACSTSGCGESLIKTVFAKECANSLLTDACEVIALQEFVQKKFLDSPFLRDVKEKLAGALVLKCESDENRAEFLWAHTTESMCIGYQSTANSKAVARMSRLPERKPSTTFVIEGTSIKL